MTKTYQSVKVNEFVTRQIKGSGKTYSPDLSFGVMAEYAEKILREHPGRVKTGYRDGTVLVQCDPEFSSHFISPMVKIDENTELEAILTKRRKREKPYIQIRALDGEPLPTGRVELILYRQDVLAENDEQSTNADWELIAFQAVPEGMEKLPMGPVTMMRNQFELPGGTASDYSSDEWAEAVRFWQEYAFIKPLED